MTADPEPLPARRDREVIVIGAGPAGSAVAIEAARTGAEVLLLERGTFPREKVCGGCVSGSALPDLRALGVLPELIGAGALPLHRFRWSAGGRPVELPLPGGLSVTRSVLDDHLLRRAQAEGVSVCTGVTARPGPVRDRGRVVALRRGAKTREVRAGGRRPLARHPAAHPRAQPPVRRADALRRGRGRLHRAVHR